MAQVSYVEIEKQLGEHLDARLDGVTVLVEDEVIIANESQPVVAIYFERRKPAPNQYMNKRRVDYHLIYTLLCWTFSMEGPLAAAYARDDLVARVEEVMLGDRTEWGPPGAIETSWIEGGEMPTGRLPNNAGFASVGEIRLVVVANATSSEG